MEKFLYNRIVKKNPKINLWWCYGASESFALSTLGYLNIFKYFDVDPDICVERIYSNSTSFEINPKNVDFVGFSISFELDIFNIISMLKKYNFPLNSSLRGEKDPIIFAGGFVISSNPFCFQDIFDFFVMSDMVSLDGVLKVIKNKNNKSRDEILKELSELNGIYVPKFPKTNIKILRDDLSQNIFYTPILSDKSYFQNTFIAELERGCPKMCNFCSASWLNLPFRMCSYEKIIQTLELGLKYTNKIALLGAYVAGNKDFSNKIDFLSKKDIELNISSLRADLADEKLFKTLVKCGQKTATVALEAGSFRLREFINKDLSDEEFTTTILTMAKAGLKGAKIYFMIGLPTETDEDILSLIGLMKNIKSKLKIQNTPGFNLTISSSSFVPKLNTPFEEMERFDKKILQNRINILNKELSKLGISYKAPSLDWDIVQSILSRYTDSLFHFLVDVE